MLKQHIYDPYFNIKKDTNIKSLINKLEKCFDHITNNILPQIQTKETYLCDLYKNLFMESISAQS